MVQVFVPGIANTLFCLQITTSRMRAQQMRMPHFLRTAAAQVDLQQHIAAALRAHSPEARGEGSAFDVTPRLQLQRPSQQPGWYDHVSHQSTDSQELSQHSHSHAEADKAVTQAPALATSAAFTSPAAHAGEETELSPGNVLFGPELQPHLPPAADASTVPRHAGKLQKRDQVIVPDQADSTECHGGTTAKQSAVWVKPNIDPCTS